MNTVSFRNPKSEIRNRQGRWFLVQIKEIVDCEEELAETQNLAAAPMFS